MRLLLAVLFLMSGCRAAVDGDVANDTTQNTPPPELDQQLAETDQSRRIEADFSVEVTGAESFTWQRRDWLDVTRIDAEGQLNLLTLGFRDMKLVDGVAPLAFRFAVDVLDLYQDQPSVLTVTTQAPSAGPDESSKVDNAAFLVVTRPTSGGNVDVRQFDQLLEPCTLVLADELREGQVTCPELGLQSGQSVRLIVRWVGTGVIHRSDE